MKVVIGAHTFECDETDNWTYTDIDHRVVKVDPVMAQTLSYLECEYLAWLDDPAE
jgi:hypothetical protein